jgi:Predicted pPIWI-associating nuclease
MTEKPDPEDPLVATEALLEKARKETERQALAWQKAHQATDRGYDLLRHFNSERKQLTGNEQFTFADTIFANASGISLFDLAKSIEHPADATLTAGTSQILLSGLQSNIASYISAPIDFGIKNPFPKTVAILESQQVPIEDRLPALKRRLSKFSNHFSGMITGIEADLMNQSNPLALSNAAKNLRETLTSFIHTVAPDGIAELWPDCERDEKNRPTRRSRLGCHTFLKLPKKNWPKAWVSRVEKRIGSVLDSFHDLNKFTHINEGTADALKTARVSLDRFVSEYLLYLDTADNAYGVLQDLLMGAVETELTELAEGELHS